MGPEQPPRASRPGWRKQVAFALVVYVAFFGLAEGVARVGGWVSHGFDPYYLLFGFRDWRKGDWLSERLEGYYKFPPSRVLTLPGMADPRHGTGDGGRGRATARINDRGFRGPDFAPRKPPGTFRIICMGASSTFGYRNYDDDTYPARLQQRFDRRPGPLRVEVINAGVPDMLSHEMLALLRRELIEYEPDVVTFYEGYNDARHSAAESAVQRLQRWLDTYSAAYAALRNVVEALGGRVYGRLQGHPPGIDRATLDRQVDLHVREFRNNVASMIEVARSRGAEVILIKQAARRAGLKPDPRTHEQRHRDILAELDRTGSIPPDETILVIHRAQMQALEELAREHRLPLVDNQALVDADWQDLLTHVHLSAEANARLASAIYDAVEPIVASREAKLVPTAGPVSPR